MIAAKNTMFSSTFKKKKKNWMHSCDATNLKQSFLIKNWVNLLLILIMVSTAVPRLAKTKRGRAD